MVLHGKLWDWKKDGSTIVHLVALATLATLAALGALGALAALAALKRSKPGTPAHSGAVRCHKGHSGTL